MNIHTLLHPPHPHHAYLVVGPTEASVQEINAALQSRGVKTDGNPDILSLSFSDLRVDDVRDVILPFAALSPIKDKKYLVLSFSRANDASQNALLKAVEESMGRTTFFFCVENAGHILPTLRSRTIVLKMNNERHVPNDSDAHAFLGESYAKRLARVESMARSAAKTHDRTPARIFAEDVLVLARERKFSVPALRDILDAASYLRMQGSSIKAALSHLAVMLPRIK